jgi:hypothetical protein
MIHLFYFLAMLGMTVLEVVTSQHRWAVAAFGFATGVSFCTLTVAVMK